MAWPGVNWVSLRESHAVLLVVANRTWIDFGLVARMAVMATGTTGRAARVVDRPDFLGGCRRRRDAGGCLRASGSTRVAGGGILPPSWGDIEIMG